VFPVIFVILKNSNLYGSWRHFLFLYPGIILFSALGIHAFLIRFKQQFVRMATAVLFLILLVHPLKFMAMNHPYFYLYYNQLVGGLSGAYGNYETDYYYTSIREGAEWLQEYLKDKPQQSDIIVGSNFESDWYFRKNENVKCVYFPWQKRSNYNWDYAIVANSYISPFQLKNQIWPPANSLYTIYADGVPICAVLERVTNDDFYGIQEQKQGSFNKSVLMFQKALLVDPENELIYYKFAEVLLATNQPDSAKQALKKCLEINPDYEPALVLAGDLAARQNDLQEAVRYYEEAIGANRKYFSAYTRLAGIYAETDVVEAQKVLMDCLKLNRRYKPALTLLAETYRKTDPLRAEKIDRINRSID
jgi:tetratricopeptide (TPR) repeat protein